MTAKQALQLIDRIGFVSFANYRNVNNIRFQCRILDVRPGSFGRTDILVTPLSGEGKDWISLERIALK